MVATARAFLPKTSSPNHTATGAVVQAAASAIPSPLRSPHRRLPRSATAILPRHRSLTNAHVSSPRIHRQNLVINPFGTTLVTKYYFWLEAAIAVARIFNLHLAKIDLQCLGAIGQSQNLCERQMPVPHQRQSFQILYSIHPLLTMQSCLLSNRQLPLRDR